MQRTSEIGVFVRILLPFIAGIVAFYGFTCVFWIQITCLLLFLCLLFSNMRYKALRLYRYKGFIGAGFYLFMFLLGGLWTMLNNESRSEDYYAGKQGQFLRIIINEEPQLKNRILRFKAKVNLCYHDLQGSGKAATGSLMVAVLTDSLNKLLLAYGDELIIPYKITPVKSFSNGSDFDYTSWLAAQNIYHQTFIRQNELVTINHHQGNPIIDFALKLRKDQVAFYRKIIRDNEAFAVATTLILGYRADLDKETLGTYSRTGTIHALSVSGMHVGLVYLVLNWMLQFMDRKRWLNAVKLVIIVVAIWFYAVLTGFSPSVLRSVIMLSVFIIAKSFARNTDSYNILAFAAFCLLIYDPFLIWNIGFQLSFLAVLGLIWIQPMIQNWWHVKQNWAFKLWGLVAMSLSAQLITFPFSVYYFHQFPVYFLIGNLFIMLPITLLMYLGIVILIFKIEALGAFFEWLIRFTNSGLSLISRLPLASINDIYLNRFELTVLCLAIALFILACARYKKKLLFASLICFVLLQSSLSYSELKQYGLIKSGK